VAHIGLKDALLQQILGVVSVVDQPGLGFGRSMQDMEAILGHLQSLNLNHIERGQVLHYLVKLWVEKGRVKSVYDIWQGRCDKRLQAAPLAALWDRHCVYTGAQISERTRLCRLRAAFSERQQVHLVSLRNLSDQIVVAESRPLLRRIRQLWCQKKDSFPAGEWSTGAHIGYYASRR
jgi:hypothetical protein